MREQGGREGGGVNSCLGHDVHLPGVLRFDSAVNVTVQRHHADDANLGRRRSGIYHSIGRLIESRTAEGGAEEIQFSRPLTSMNASYVRF